MFSVEKRVKKTELMENCSENGNFQSSWKWCHRHICNAMQVFGSSENEF